MHEQVLAGAQAGLGDERVVGGREHLRQTARLGPLERVGHGHGGALVDECQLGLSAAADHRHHALPLGETARAGAERGHLPGKLEAGYVLGLAGGRRIGPAPLQHVRAVQPRGAHAHQDLPVAGLRIGVLLDDESAVPDRHGAHGAGNLTAARRS